MKPTSHRQNLAALGFPKSVAAEAGRAAKRDLFALRPSPDLIRRTIERCVSALEGARHERGLKGQATPELVDALALTLREAGMGMTVAEEDFRHALPLAAAHWRIGGHPLTPERLASAIEAVRRRERPMMLVDNHCVFSPTWWEQDSGLSGMRKACAAIDDVARDLESPRSGVLVVTRAESTGYSDPEALSFGRFLAMSSCDVWLVDHGRAGVFQHRDAVVGSRRWALTLTGRPNSPAEAVSGFKEERPSEAASLKAHVENTTAIAVAVRVEGRMVGAEQDFRDAKAMQGLLRSPADAGHGG